MEIQLIIQRKALMFFSENISLQELLKKRFWKQVLCPIIFNRLFTPESNSSSHKGIAVFLYNEGKWMLYDLRCEGFIWRQFEVFAAALTTWKLKPEWGSLLSGQPSQASVSHQQPLGRGTASLLSARLCLSWGPCHPLTLPQSCEPFGQAYRIEEKLLCMEFKGLRCLHCKVSEEGLGWVCLICFYLVLEGRTQRCYLSTWFFMSSIYFLYTHSILIS